MYHEVMSRGNIVHSGIHIARHVRKRSVQFEELGGEIEFDELDEDIPSKHKLSFSKYMSIKWSYRKYRIMLISMKCMHVLCC